MSKSTCIKNISIEHVLNPFNIQCWIMQHTFNNSLPEHIFMLQSMVSNKSKIVYKYWWQMHWCISTHHCEVLFIDHTVVQVQDTLKRAVREQVHLLQVSSSQRNTAHLFPNPRRQVQIQGLFRTNGHGHQNTQETILHHVIVWGRRWVQQEPATAGQTTHVSLEKNYILLTKCKSQYLRCTCPCCSQHRQCCLECEWADLPHQTATPAYREYNYEHLNDKQTASVCTNKEE